MSQEYSVAEECVEAMRNGERDLDKLASRYPWARDEIRPLLDVGLALLVRTPKRHIRAALRA